MKGSRQPATIGEPEIRADGRLQVPDTWAEAGAMNRALAALPRRRVRDYRKKLVQRDTGIIAELQVLGRLLERLQPPALVPYPEAPTVEALLTVDSIQYELEIKALLGTEWEISRERLYRRIERDLAARFPQWQCRVRVADRGILSHADHPEQIDAERTSERILTQFVHAIHGRAPGERIVADNTPDRLVLTIDPAEGVHVYTGEQERDWDHGLQTFRRKLDGALTKATTQFSGTRPAVLAVVCARDAGAPRFLTEQYGLADAALRDHPHLTAILALPYLSYTESTIALAWRDSAPASGAAVVPSERASQQLLALFSMSHLGLHERHVAEFAAALKADMSARSGAAE